MKFAPHRTIVEIKPDTDQHGDTQILGTVTPVVLDCGHVVPCNQIFTYKLGASMPCYECLEEYRRTS